MNTGQELAEWDWLISMHSRRLHHAALTEEQGADVIDEGGLPDVVTACGRTLKWAMIPGVLTRMGEPRCARCCTVLGYPQRIGSPKNDACRPLVERRLSAA